MSDEHHGSRLWVDGQEVKPISDISFNPPPPSAPEIVVNFLPSNLLDYAKRAAETGEIVRFLLGDEDDGLVISTKVAEIIEEEIDDETHAQITFRVLV